MTYAETPTKWRRLTISLDYRKSLGGSLEAALKTLSDQQDKSLFILEALHRSLDEIHYYDTVTNLRLETTDDLQLHVHVNEEVNDVVQFPSVALVKHITCPHYTQGDVELQSHVSGFDYEVCVKGQHLIMKEIPGPGMVEDFLGEVNEMDATDSNTIRLEGLITDEEGLVVKGLLIPDPRRNATLRDVLEESDDDESYDADDDDDDESDDNFSQPREPPKTPVVIAEPEVECFIQGTKVAAFPDLGSCQNIISDDFAQRNRIVVDRSKQTMFQTAVGSRAETLGVARLPFQFAQETDTFVEDFHVLGKCLYDVILGNPFLTLTKTFSHFAHRVSKKLRVVSSCYRVGFTGSPQQMLAGWANGHPTLALPDTGADISLMSLEHAISTNHRVNYNYEHRKLLQFVDGSVALTSGLVEDFQWEFELAASSSQVYCPKVYILEDLQTDLVLSFDFLSSSQALSAHADLLIDLGPHGLDVAEVNAIKLAGESMLWKLGRDIRRKIRRESSSRQASGKQMHHMT